jgi:hydroxymethylglutaryl-CoA lyase
MLHGLGVATGIDVPRLLDAADYITAALGRPTSSRAGRALRAAAARAKQEEGVPA